MLIFTKSLNWGFRQWRLIGLLFLVNIGIAIMVSLPFFNLLDQHLGSSLIAQDLLDGFDYTVFSDFVAHYGAGFSSILYQLNVVIFIYYILSVLFSGGIFHFSKEREQSFSVGVFFNQSSHYFWRMLLLSLTFIAFIIIVGGILFKLFLIINKNGDLAKLPSDAYFFKWFIAFFCLFLWKAFLLMIWHQLAKVYLVYRRASWWKALKNSFVIVYQNLWTAIFLFLFFLVLFGLGIIVYQFLGGIFPVNTNLGILFSLFLAQLFILFRLGSRLALACGMSMLFENISRP